MYRAVTNSIQVTVAPTFRPERSNPDERNFFWSYEVEIVNLGARTVQLVARWWIVTDAFGAIEHVRGAGVVGEQPILRPGESFRYVSGCPLATPTGIMEGRYFLIDDSGLDFEAQIPAFSLDSPYMKKVLN